MELALLLGGAGRAEHGGALGTPAATVFAFCGVREESSALRFTKSTAEALETVLVGRGGTGGFFFLARAFSSASERSLSSGGGAHAVKMRPGGPDGLGQAKLAARSPPSHAASNSAWWVLRGRRR